MAQDDKLEKLALRIKARAIRRSGELLEQVSARGRNQHTPEDTAAAHRNQSQREVAAEAGISEHQQKQAVNVASVPQAEFDNQVESDKPPTVTKLAEQGRKERPKPALTQDQTPDIRHPLVGLSVGSP